MSDKSQSGGPLDYVWSPAIQAITFRELGAYFYSPVAYVVLAIFLALCGFFFASDVFVAGSEASLRGLLMFILPMVLLAMLPLLSMRLLSEEMRTGTLETLMTAPVTESEVILGKFYGAVAFFKIMIAGTLLYVILLALFGQVDWRLTLSQYIGVLLLGALYLSVGLFYSAWTSSQIVAGVLSIVTLLVFTWLTNVIAVNVPIGWIKASLQHLTILTHYQGLVRGRLAVEHLAFFLSTTALFLFLTTKVLESKRWR